MDEKKKKNSEDRYKPRTADDIVYPWMERLADEWQFTENALLKEDEEDEDFRKNQIEPTDRDALHFTPDRAEAVTETEDGSIELDLLSKYYGRSRSEDANILIRSFMQEDSSDNQEITADNTRLGTPTFNRNGKNSTEPRPSPRISDIADVTADFPTTNNPFERTSDNNTTLMGVASSNGTSAKTLNWLAGNPDPEIRKTVANNSNTPLEVLRKLSEDWDGTVRLAVLDNATVTNDIITSLLNDANPLVSLRACYALDQRRKATNGTPNKAASVTIKDMPNLRAYQGYLKSSKEEPITSDHSLEAINFLKIVAERLTTPSQRLTELSSHPDPDVRAAVAGNSKSPMEALWRLAQDMDPMVRTTLAHNQSCPVELLQQLLKDPNKKVKGTAMLELHKIDQLDNMP
jgi:hypothetical protein